MSYYMLLSDFKDYIKDYYDDTDKPYIFDADRGKYVNKKYYLNNLADDTCENLKNLNPTSLRLFKYFLISEVKKDKKIRNKDIVNIEDLKYTCDKFMKKYFYKYINDDNEIVSGDLYTYIYEDLHNEYLRDKRNALLMGYRETAVKNNDDKIKNILHELKSILYYRFINHCFYDCFKVNYDLYSSNPKDYNYNPFETLVEYKDLTNKNFKPIYDYVRQQIKNAIKEMGFKKAYKDYAIIKYNIEKKLFGCVRYEYDKTIKEIGKPEDYGYLKYNIYMNPYDLTDKDFMIIYDKVCDIFTIMQYKLKDKILKLIKRKRENKEKEDEE